MADDSGLAKFQRRMKAIPVEVRRAVVPALEKSAEEIASVMRATVPVDEGDLKASIRVTGPGLSTPPYSQPGGSLIVPELTSAVTAGNADVRYAHLVEYGHSNGVNNSVVPPHPFFWPSVRLGQKRAMNRIKRAISKAVREAK